MILSVQVEEVVTYPVIDTEVDGLGLKEFYPIKEWTNCHVGRRKMLPIFFKRLYLTADHRKRLATPEAHPLH